MSKFNWMPILKTGTFKAKNGKHVTFDENKLDQIIANTDLKTEPQFVIEHPVFDKLGFGTISELKRVGNYLFALPKKVEEKFKNAVNIGELPGRSVSLDQDTLALSSIGFLPKEIEPAVDGLGGYSFSTSPLPSPYKGEGMKLRLQLEGVESHFAEVADDKYEFSSEVSSYPFRNIKSILKNLKYFLTEKFGMDAAEKAIPEWDLEQSGNPPSIFETTPNVTETANSFSQNTNGDTMNKVELSTLNITDPKLKAALETLVAENEQLTSSLATAKTELSTATQKISAGELAASRKEVLQFCESDEMKLKILPAEKENTVQYLLAQKAKGKIEFSSLEKPDEKLQIDTYEFAKAQLKQLPNKIELSELATTTTASTKNEPDYVKVGNSIAEIANKGR